MQLRWFPAPPEFSRRFFFVTMLLLPVSDFFFEVRLVNCKRGQICLGRRMTIFPPFVNVAR